jgi:ribosomal-protein-alanine N-acetyltransferase
VTVLRTERLVLRPARWDDLEPLHAIFSDPIVMRYWSRPPHATMEQTREWLGSMIDSAPETSADFIVELDGCCIGKAGFFRLPEIGFILAREHWRKGLAHEALAAILDHTFEARGLEAAEADVDPRNEASLGLLKKLGFVETGRAERTYQIAGEWVDSVYLRLARDLPDPGVRE